MVHKDLGGAGIDGGGLEQVGVDNGGVEGILAPEGDGLAILLGVGDFDSVGVDLEAHGEVVDKLLVELRLGGLGGACQ